MWQKLTFLYRDFLVSGHSFENDETLLKFQYKVINAVLIVFGLFSFIFSALSSLGINPLGNIQTVANYLLSFSAIFIIIRLRGPKERYLQCAYLMYGACFLDFVSAFIFVPDDEFRMIWFYLLAFAAYITGGARAGNTIIFLSMGVMIFGNVFLESGFTQKAMISSILGLVITMLFFRAYTKKLIDFEQEIIEQKSLMITQSRFAAMGEMMSMIAHQWRQPLSTTTLLITDARVKLMMAGEKKNEYDKILEDISDTMIYLSDTIDDFQTYFKPGKSTEEIYVSEIINRVDSFTHARITLSNVNFYIQELDEELIDTYANELVQVLINIVNNSIDVLVERDVENRTIWIKVYSNDEQVIIQIEDNAGGIDNNIIDKVFEPYFSSKSKNGTGLGLYMAKMIIEKHIGGKLNVINTANGACFTIVLPKNQCLSL